MDSMAPGLRRRESEEDLKNKIKNTTTHSKPSIINLKKFDIKQDDALISFEVL